MADVLIIGIREEDKDDFTVELIKGLMSRGLTVSYAGAFYCERKDCYVYDDVTNLLFFSSAYFREANMKSNEFKTWKGFLDNIDFEQVDARFVIYAVTCKQKIKPIVAEFSDRLDNLLKEAIVKLIRSSFEKNLLPFKSQYPEIIEVLGLTKELLDGLKLREYLGGGIEWRDERVFREFMRKCRDLEGIIERGESTETVLRELDEIQRNIEQECLEDQSKAQHLVEYFFEFSKEDLIDNALENRERILYFDLLRKIPEKIIFCLYYEEKYEKKEMKYNLYFYPEQLKMVTGESEEESGESEEESGESEEGSGESEEGSGESSYEFFYHFELPQIPRSPLPLESPRDLYNPKKIEETIDKHIMRALHPSPIDIHFPNENFMIGIDPEEPEIGFLSRKVTLSCASNLETTLNIENGLRENLRIYGLKNERNEKGVEYRKFRELKKGYTKDGQEDVLILSRVEYLYDVLIAKKWYNNIYESIFSALKYISLLAILLLTWNIWKIYLIDVPKSLSILFRTFFLISIIIFVFWILKTLILNFLLEPMYKILRWSSYILLLFILSLSTESLETLGRFVEEILSLSIESSARLGGSILFLIPLLIEIFLFRSYIRSAVFYELNDMIGIIDHKDALEIQNLDGQGVDETVHVLRCGRFQTIIERNNEEEVYPNSKIFPRIKYISRKFRIKPREMVYSSGILVFSENDKNEKESQLAKKEASVEELLYRKPRTWRFWRIVENFFFGKGGIEDIEPGVELDDKHSPSNRFIYFGRWGHVMKCIGSAMPVFPQSALFRNMLILVALSVLFFSNFSRGISLSYFLGWIENPSFWSIIPLILIFIVAAIRLGVRLWRILLSLAIFILLDIQPPSIRIWVVVVPIFLILYLLWFPMLQTLSSFAIWFYEKMKVRKVSVEIPDGLRGTSIRRNLMVTRMIVDDEGERIYFNHRFFCEFILPESIKNHLKLLKERICSMRSITAEEEE